MKVLGLEISKASTEVPKPHSKRLSRGKRRPGDDEWAAIRHLSGELNDLKRLYGDLRRDVWRIEKAGQTAKKGSVKNLVTQLAPHLAQQIQAAAAGGNHKPDNPWEV